MKQIKNYSVGKQVIIRTYSAGVWYGTVVEKTDTEVLIADARRVRTYKNLGTEISLSGICRLGIHPGSQVEHPISEVLLQWIEILPCTPESIVTFSAQPAAKAS